MVGRRAELQQLRELWLRVSKGQSHLVMISGEPGVGKTRFANEVVVHARLVGATVLRGGCYEYEATTPYLPFVEALRHWVHGQTPDVLRSRVGPLAPELARLAPEIAAKIGPLEPSPALAPHEERLRLFDHIARLLQGLARERGLLLLLDDLHWADQGTLSLLQYLMRNPREERLLVLGAYREAELDRSHPLAALVDWNRERLATRIALPRLALESTTEMLATLFGQDTVSPDFAAALQRETEGNPFFVEEVVKTLIEQGQIYREGGDWQRREVAELAIPQSIRAARLDRLSKGCTRTLHTAAALGKTFEFGELAAVAEASEDELLDTLDEAAAAQVVRAEEGTFAFTHDKIREVLLDELNPIRRRRLHQRIGEGLERLLGEEAHTRAQDLAHHFVLSGDLGRGLDYSLRAAAHAEKVFAHDEAIGFYGRGRECAEALKRTGALTDIEESMGRVYDHRGDFAHAVAHYERALALAENKSRRAALKARVGAVYGNYGDARGLPFLEESLKELDPERQTNERELATALIGRYHHYRAKHLHALEYLEQARRLAEPIGDPETLRTIYGYIAGAYQHLARFEESMEWARRCKELGERTGYLEATRVGWEFLAEDSSWLGYWDDALRYTALNREIAERIGSFYGLAWSELPRGWALLARGQLDESASVMRGAIAITERVGEDRLAILLRTCYAQVLVEQGDDEAARAQAEMAIRQADHLGQAFLRSEARFARLYLALRRGRWTEVAATCEECDTFMMESENVLYVLLLGWPRSEAHLELGRMDEAQSALHASLEAAHRAKCGYPEARVRKVEARWLAARGKADAAAKVFDEVVAAFEKQGSRLELGYALLSRADFRARRGNASASEADRARAQEIFSASGSRSGLAALSARP